MFNKLFNQSLKLFIGIIRIIDYQKARDYVKNKTITNFKNSLGFLFLCTGGTMVLRPPAERICRSSILLPCFFGESKLPTNYKNSSLLFILCQKIILKN